MTLHAAALRYSALLGLLGALLTLPAVSALLGAPSPPEWSLVARGLVAWPGAVALLLSLMYLGKAAGGAPERSLFALGPFAGILLLPYTIFGLLVLLLSRARSREPLADPVAAGVWVGGMPLPAGRERMLGLGVGAVLNLCIEFPDLAGVRAAGIPYRRIPLLDGAAPHPDQLDEAVRWAEEQHRQGRTVYVHCAQGHGRSATVATALLVRLGVHADPEAAREAIQAARPGTRLGPAQRAVVARWCAQRGSVGPTPQLEHVPERDPAHHQEGDRDEQQR